MEYISDGEERSFGEVAEREPGEDAQTDESEDADASESDNGADDQTDTETETDNQDDDSEDDDQDNDDDDDPEDEKTEKGTKLDKDPKSAVHQQLANERKVRGQMETVLADPAKMQVWLEKQFGIKVQLDKGTAQQTETTEAAGDQTQAEQPVFKKYTKEDLQNIEDVANVINGLQESFQKELKSRDDQIKDLSTNWSNRAKVEQATRVADTIELDMNSLRKQPELDPKSPDFIEGLEDDISAHYHKLDFDTKTEMYAGNHSLREIGKSFINAARKARKVGSQKAQTIVRTKRGGQVRTSTKTDASSGSEQQSPEASIASGIAKMFGGK